MLPSDQYKKFVIGQIKQCIPYYAFRTQKLYIYVKIIGYTENIIRLRSKNIIYNIKNQQVNRIWEINLKITNYKYILPQFLFNTVDTFLLMKTPISVDIFE